MYLAQQDAHAVEQRHQSCPRDEVQGLYAPLHVGNAVLCRLGTGALGAGEYQVHGAPLGPKESTRHPTPWVLLLRLTEITATKYFKQLQFRQINEDLHERF